MELSAERNFCPSQTKLLDLSLLSADLRFHEHINKIIQTVNSLLGPLYCVAKLLPRDILDQINYTYIRPHSDYCDIVYYGNLTITGASRLERLQTRIARLVTGALPRTPTDRLLDDLGWERLKTRRTVHILLFFHRITHNHIIPHSLIISQECVSLPV